ncbi:hypothetical protein [Actinacidiphila rubida]|uniref:Uncharacterized protein n=1 Tax=Actinacidiphila rubida TaxID=310780 RepID=A0A1H8DX40_9ACTN|nr:hypothetical protein [Actinacidiphila rubida]SEN11424.1 hypothetical protein SAMN05216267_1001329 [Actinacidiphila rubida]
MPFQRGPAGSTEEQVSIIGTLIALPFPAEESRSATPHGWGGPGHHLAVLRQSRDFWEARDPETLTEAQEELETELSALAALLTVRWGSPAVVDLRPFLGLDDADYPDVEAPPEPLNSLCMQAVSMQVWHVPSTERWLGLTVGQADRELNCHLRLARTRRAKLERPGAVTGGRESSAVVSVMMAVTSGRARWRDGLTGPRRKRRVRTAVSRGSGRTTCWNCGVRSPRPR